MGPIPPDNLGDLTDEVLVGLVLALLARDTGEAWKPFEVLYRRYVQEVLNTVYRFLLRQYTLLDRDLAWQLTQETFLQAWNHIPQKNPQAPFLAWVRAIGINEARQHIRHLRREIALKDDPPEDDPPDDHPPGDTDLVHQAPEKYVEQLLSSTELHEHIEYVKQRLTEQQRKVFSMYHEQGYTRQEIARELGLKPTSVSQMLWRAHARFRDEWQKTEGKREKQVSTRKTRKRGTSGPAQQS